MKDAIDVIDGVDRKPIDVSRMGVNAFANDSRFGSIPAQYREVRDTLGLKYVRVLFAWNDAVQSAKGANINWSFYDAIADAIPAGVDALVVVTNVPSWMNNSSNWDDANPRTTFVNEFFRPLVRRYRNNGRIVGYQVWNEPNNTGFSENETIQVLDSPENYVELLALAYSVVKDISPSKLVLNAATTSINQNSNNPLDYNRRIRDAGGFNFLDRFAIHYYGKQYENFIRQGGVKDFLGSVPKQIWITESGIQGFDKQLAYVEEVWPYLREKIGGLDRIYYYQFTSAASADSAFGLRNLSSETPVSDLYVHLRERNG
ncbi:MAG: cellulase family glycosylhydrolase [Bdellovibrionales bacterium]|nr:cellulase family glycosylhydrolase [Bdellovibrionales bacterium]